MNCCSSNKSTVLTFNMYLCTYTCMYEFLLLQQGLTALHHASANGHIQVIEALTQAGASVSAISKVRESLQLLVHTYVCIYITYVDMYIYAQPCGYICM